MKAVVLAAGKGTRLGELTQQLPKPMIEVDGQPVLHQNLAWLAAAGITDVAINLHHQPDLIRDSVGDGAQFGLRVSYSYEKELLGTAGAVARIVDTLWEGLDEAFVVLYGDNLYQLDLASVLAFHREHAGAGTLALHYREDVLQSGIVELNETHRILQFIEKPSPDQVVSHLVNTGLYVLEPDVVDVIPREGPSDFGKEIFPALLIGGALLHGFEPAGVLVPIDTPALLQSARSRGQQS